MLVPNKISIINFSVYKVFPVYKVICLYLFTMLNYNKMHLNVLSHTLSLVQTKHGWIGKHDLIKLEKR